MPFDVFRMKSAIPLFLTFNRVTDGDRTKIHPVFLTEQTNSIIIQHRSVFIQQLS